MILIKMHKQHLNSLLQQLYKCYGNDQRDIFMKNRQNLLSIIYKGTS